jgi:hypothetical protein
MFSPRAIMRREPKAEADTPAPRRERPRIAARAMPAAPAPAATPTVSEVDPEAKVPVDLILDHARETGELLSAVVSRGQSSEMRRINNDLGGVMDTIMLMQLEKGHAPADDALTLLLQLKRELETLRAL